MFTAVPMTLGTVIAIIPNFFVVFVIHFVLSVAAGACPTGCIAAGMARLTVIVCSFMIGRKRVVK